MSNQDRPTPEDIVPQSDYPASQRDLVPQPDSDLSKYSPGNNLTGKVALITGGDFGDMIINTGSVVGTMNKGMLVDYSTFKGAVHTFIKSLILNLDEGIWVRVPAVKRWGFLISIGDSCAVYQGYRLTGRTVSQNAL